jgi:hypothetical protein
MNTIDIGSFNSYEFAKEKFKINNFSTILTTVYNGNHKSKVNRPNFFNIFNV